MLPPNFLLHLEVEIMENNTNLCNVKIKLYRELSYSSNLLWRIDELPIQTKSLIKPPSQPLLNFRDTENSQL